MKNASKLTATTDFEVLLAELEGYQDQLKRAIYGFDTTIKKLHQRFITANQAREVAALKKANGCEHLVEGCADKDLQDCFRGIGENDKALKRSQNPKTACRKAKVVDYLQASLNTLKKSEKRKAKKEREEAGARLCKAAVEK
jgi:hypothetical protein